MSDKKEYTLEEIETMLDAFSIESDDFTGVLPIDLKSLNFCDRHDIQNTVNPDAPNSIEDIEALINSDNIKSLLDSDTLLDKLRNLCNDIINGNDTNNSDDTDMDLENYAIIEFGDDYTKGDKVEYEFYIKPGETIKSDTILGTVVLNDIRLPLRSIFKKGTVMADPEYNDKYFRLYPSKTSRHFIITNYELSDGCGFNQSDIDSIGDEMNDNTDLYNLIKDHIVFSLLPIILTNHETAEEDKEHNPLYNICPYSLHGTDVYTPLIDEYVDLIDSYGDKIKDACSSKNIKSSVTGDMSMKDLSDKMLSIREDILADVIKIYEKGCNSTEKLVYDNYLDCLQLSLFTYSNLKYNQLKSDTYNNYYGYLIANLDIENNTNKYVQEYYGILKQIIQNRQRYETANKQTLIDEFNKLYTRYVNFKVTNGYYILDANVQDKTSLEDIQQHLTDTIKQNISDIITKLTDEFLEITKLLDSNINPEKTLRILSFNNEYKQNISNDDNNAYNTLLKKGNNWLTKDNINNYLLEHSNDNKALIYASSDNKEISSKETYLTLAVYKRLSRLYMFINSLDTLPDNFAIEEFTDEYTPLDLVKEEAELIKNFWTKCIETYYSKSINDMINDMKDKANSYNQYASWPTAITLDLNGLEYNHYLFINPVSGSNSNTSDDNSGIDNANDFDENATPNIPEADDSATNVSNDEAVNALNNHEAAKNEEKKDKEITPIDTAYWRKYFALATVISLPFLADGYDVPPAMVPTPLPGIYIAFSATFIKYFNVTIVIGLAIRGIYISPVLLIVNMSDLALSPLLPLIGVVKKVKEQFNAAIGIIEKSVPNLVNVFINKLETENQQYLESNKQYEALLKALENAVVENLAIIKKNMEKLAHPEKDHRQNIQRTLDIVKNAAEHSSESASDTNTDN